jgi:hypothetical protein
MSTTAKNALIIGLILLFQEAMSQTSPLPNPPEGWTRLIIKEVGTIDIPQTLEMQSGAFQKMSNDYYNILELDSPDFIAQQAGLNERYKQGVSRYARVLLNTTIGEDEEFEPLFFNIESYSKFDVAEIDRLMHSSLESELTQNGAKLITWYPTSLERVNGMSCVHYRFRRQIEGKPIVIVNSYVFSNNDRQHTLTLSYREEDANYWKEDFEKIRDSFRITSIR